MGNRRAVVVQATQSIPVLLRIVQQQVWRAAQRAAARVEFFQLLAHLAEVHTQDARDLALAAQLNGSSYVLGGHALGLGQFQSTSGIG